MRKIKYFVANSLDGFSRRDGSVDWLFMDQDYGMAEFFQSVDVAVMGRKTYDKMLELVHRCEHYSTGLVKVFYRVK